MGLNYSITDNDMSIVTPLLREISSRYASVESPEFLRDVTIYSHELPRPLRSFLQDFKLLEPQAGCCLISGYPVDDAKIGPTPSHWKIRPENSPVFEEEIFLILCGSILGDVFGWATQQDGRIVHNVMPIKGHENEQLGTGSEQLLWWHIEDAFHPYRSDYIGMMCMRNPDKIATIVASVDISKLAPGHIEILFQQRFTIRPDNSHQEKTRSDVRHDCDEYNRLLDSSYQRIKQMNENPEPVQVLYGDPAEPYVRIDPYFMETPEDDLAAKNALDALTRLIDEYLVDLVLSPGDCCFFDNYKLVHGRREFKARHDGYDRWLNRINITRDLRKSRGSRTHSTSRTII